MSSATPPSWTDFCPFCTIFLNGPRGAKLQSELFLFLIIEKRIISFKQLLTELLFKPLFVQLLHKAADDELLGFTGIFREPAAAEYVHQLTAPQEGELLF